MRKEIQPVSTKTESERESPLTITYNMVPMTKLIRERGKDAVIEMLHKMVADTINGIQLGGKSK